MIFSMFVLKIFSKQCPLMVLQWEMSICSRYSALHKTISNPLSSMLSEPKTSFVSPRQCLEIYPRMVLLVKAPNFMVFSWFICKNIVSNGSTSALFRTALSLSITIFPIFRYLRWGHLAKFLPKNEIYHYFSFIKSIVG